MKILVILAIVFLCITFTFMYISRHRSIGTIALHRHPKNIRRGRKENPEINDTLGFRIVTDPSTTGMSFYLVNEKTAELEG